MQTRLLIKQTESIPQGYQPPVSEWRRKITFNFTEIESDSKSWRGTAFFRNYTYNSQNILVICNSVCSDNYEKSKMLIFFWLG